MKTMFKPQELWDLVEEGFEDANPETPNQKLRETRKKGCNGLVSHPTTRSNSTQTRETLK